MTPDHTEKMTPKEIAEDNYRRSCRFQAFHGLPKPRKPKVDKRPTKAKIKP